MQMTKMPFRSADLAWLLDVSKCTKSKAGPCNRNKMKNSLFNCERKWMRGALDKSDNGHRGKRVKRSVNEIADKRAGGKSSSTKGPNTSHFAEEALSHWTGKYCALTPSRRPIILWKLQIFCRLNRACFISISAQITMYSFSH